MAREDYRPCSPDENGTRCATHGGEYFPEDQQCRTERVLSDVRVERARQFAKYGTNEDLKDGTGTPWLSPLSPEGARDIESALRSDYEEYEEATGSITWMHLVREELAEAFAETGYARLREELIQVAALCVSWVEKIDTRADEESRGQ